MSGWQAPTRLLVAGITLVTLVLALALGIWLTTHPASARAAPWLNPTAPAAPAAPAAAPAIPCLVVMASGCPQPAGAAPVSVQAPGTVVVVGANWTPGATVTVLLVPAAQPCTTPPASSAQAHASTAGVFSVALRLPTSAANGMLYGICAGTADGKQAFPAAGLASSSPLRLRIVRSPAPPAAPNPPPPIDGFSLAALVLATLSAGVFVFTWFRGRRAQAGADH